jgi:hypothetical protein
MPILGHMLWTVPIERGWRPVLHGEWRQPAFGALMSVGALVGFLAKPAG